MVLCGSYGHRETMKALTPETVWGNNNYGSPGMRAIPFSVLQFSQSLGKLEKDLFLKMNTCTRCSKLVQKLNNSSPFKVGSLTKCLVKITFKEKLKGEETVPVVEVKLEMKLG